MTRSWMLVASPIAFATGLLLVHCSSSSSVGTGPVDSGTHSDATKQGSSSGSGSQKGSSSGSGSTSGSGSSTSSGTGSSSGSGSSAVKDGGTDAPAFQYAAGDLGDACAPPDGGAACTPGVIACGDASCTLATDECCQLQSGDTCIATGAACAGHIVQCEEAADCTGNQICCLNVMSTAVATVTCQPGPTCPPGTGTASGQYCRSNNECASGSCSFYSCTATNPATVLQLCDAPQGLLATTCTKI